MEIRFWGAAQTVTGSLHILHCNGHTLLLDCGLFQGRRAETNERNRTFPVPPARVHAVILSHAHLDHSGNLPTLVKAGFPGLIYATPATADLCAIMLTDSAHIHVKDAEFLYHQRGERIEPLYTPEDIPRTLARFFPVNYDERVRILPGVTLCFRQAGHILGSAQVLLEIVENGRTLRLGFTGDLGRSSPTLLPPPAAPEAVDVLIAESTYAGRRHEATESVRAKLHALFHEIASQRGILLIPAFAVGRTQELLFHLNALANAGELPDMPIFVDSPLAEQATRVFFRYRAEFNTTVQDLLRTDPDPFSFPQLRFTRSVEESKAIRHVDPPYAVIAGSAMCESGRILHHLRHHIGNPRTTVLFVGFNAAHTLGRRLVEGEKQVRIFGELHTVRARILEMSGLSAHADGEELLQYFCLLPSTTLIVLVHGEPSSQQLLQRQLQQEGFSQVLIPQPGQWLRL